MLLFPAPEAPTSPMTLSVGLGCLIIFSTAKIVAFEGVRGEALSISKILLQLEVDNSTAYWKSGSRKGGKVEDDGFSRFI